MQGSDWEIVGYDAPQKSNSGGGSSFADMMAPYVVQQESAGNPNAVSSAGAQGLWQIMPATGQEMAGKLGMQNFNPYDPQQSETVGKAYLNQMYDTFQDPHLALAAYNAGPGNVQRAIKQAGTNDPQAVLQFLPSETQNYVPKILGNAQRSQQPQGEITAARPSEYGAPNIAPTSSDWEIVGTEDPAPVQAVDQYKPRNAYVPDTTQPEQPTEPAPQMSTMDYANNLGAQAINSSVFNFGDNISSAYKKIPNVLQDALGMLPGMSSAKTVLGGDFLDTKKLQDFKKENPKASLGASLAGALMQPASLVSTLPRAVGSAVVYGAGDRVDNSKDLTSTSDLSRLLMGAGTDAALGTVGYGAAKLIGAGINAATGPKMSGGENLLAKRLKNVSDDTLQGAQATLKESTQPMFLPEAMQTEDLFNQAKTIANSPDTKDIAQALIKGRQEAQPGRLNSILDEVAPLTNPAEAGLKLKDASTALNTKLLENRSQIAQETFGPVYKETPVLPDEVVQDILRTPKAKSAYNELRSSREYMDYPENSTEVLHAVKSFLQSKAKVEANPNKARLLNADANYIKGVLNENVPGLVRADKVYSGLSANIDDITKDSLLGTALNKADLNTSTLGAKILSSKTDPKEVQKLIKDLGGNGEDLVLTAVRAKLSDDIANRVGGKNTVSIFDKEAIKSRLTDIMGESKASKVLSKLEDEVTIAQGTNRYKIGSDTKPNLEGALAEDYFRNAYNYYSKRGLSSLAFDALGATVGKLTSPSTKTLQDETKLIFSNDKSAEALSSILSKRDSAAKSKDITALMNLLLTRSGQQGTDYISEGRR